MQTVKCRKCGRPHRIEEWKGVNSVLPLRMSNDSIKRGEEKCISI